jgi:hypothetical protein
MRSKTILAAGIIAILLAGAAAAPSAAAAPDTDACLLVTQARLSAVLGVSMAAGAHTTPTYVKTCTWLPSGGGTKSLKFVTLNLEAGDGFERGKNMMLQMKPKNTVVTPVSGIGDDAYYIAFGTTITNLMVKKGNISFKLAFYGETAPEKVMAMEKTLALEIVGKL